MTGGTPATASHVESIGDLIRQLVADGKQFAATQIALYKAIAQSRMRVAVTGIGLAVAAAILANAAIIGIVVGLILTLTPVIGAGLSTLAVVVGTLLIAGIIGWLASSRLKIAFSSAGPAE